MLKNIWEITKALIGTAFAIGFFYALYIIMWAMAPENGLGLYQFITQH